jgi:hypothetical protein
MNVTSSMTMGNAHAAVTGGVATGLMCSAYDGNNEFVADYTIATLAPKAVSRNFMCFVRLRVKAYAETTQ